MTVKLKYVGDGSYYPGVPAGDHECDEAEAERLVAGGLYEYEDRKKQKAAAAASEADAGATEGTGTAEASDAGSRR